MGERSNRLGEVRMKDPNDAAAAVSRATVLHWYDFICPFCYIGQQRTRILAQRGLRVTELPFEIHPEIPRGGITAGPRNGPMYRILEHEAKEVQLPLNWPKRLPNTRLALAAAEWTRQHHPYAFSKLHARLFAAHFVLAEDLEDRKVIDRHATEAGVALPALSTALADGTATRAVEAAELQGRNHGVRGTPAWFIAGTLITGLRPAEEFEELARQAHAGAAAIGNNDGTQL
jgi:predicted DsbA family dithiol-disulfide isomerase